ncbi:uncharacterized protein BDW43DRAFT_315218 [Aspergillus alliaceus]|uniref:uncharacterized protein n=1 Tax=Petromyces alliaceus TaxID=209559 RepID=UPI0012A701F9|nr:uncharacterized protein BDW43DRAFT_315218 [Aspergillus alliaceus]KAB8229234.1 hypothetical protein BDW43DRAFT_315218 [Aspergillus alliaceus]
MEPSEQQWNFSPSSLLWAHEIRRENIHLADELHRTKADLASTVGAVKDLRQNFSELSQQVRQADTDGSEQFKTIEVKFETRLVPLVERIEVLEIENGELKRDFENVRREYTARLNELARTLDSMKSGSMASERRFNIIASDLVRGRSEVLVPDSLPKNNGIALMHDRGDSLRALSETTWGPSQSSSIAKTCTANICLPGEIATKGQEGLYDLFKQNMRSLGEYWSYALDARIQLPLWVKSSEIAKAFVHGLDDDVIRRLVEGHLDVAGWSWEVLADIMRQKLDEDRKAQAGTLPLRVKADPGRETIDISKVNAPIKHKKKKRKRRAIPIVPADEDDLLEMGLH